MTGNAIVSNDCPNRSTLAWVTMTNVMIYIRRNQLSLLILALLLVLLVPIGFLAAWGVHHTRSNVGGHIVFSKDGKEYLACQWVNQRYIQFGTLCFDSEPKSSPRDNFSIKTTRSQESINSQNSRSLSENLLGLGIEDGIGWIALRTGDTSARICRFNLTNAEPVQTNSIEFDAIISSTYRVLLIGGKLIQMIGAELEIREISTGKVLDSVATQMGPRSYFYPLPGTPNFLILDGSTNSAELFATSGERLHCIQKWKALQTQSFQRNDESYIAILLTDGTTIEVRNAKDGSVVSIHSAPSDSRLTLPLTYLDLRETCGCIGWRSLGIWTDVFTGRTLPIPPLFEPLVRDVESGRLVAIREENTTGRKVSNECAIVDESTEEQLLRFPLDFNERVSAGCILKKSGQLALASNDNRVHLYDMKTGVLVRVIDPFWWGVPLNCAAATLCGLWCIVWLRYSAAIHPYGWIDACVCIGLFIAYASFRCYVGWPVRTHLYFFFASMGVLMGSIQLTSYWLCLGKTRLFLRTAPLVLAFGLAAGLVTCWEEEPRLASMAVAAILPLTLGSMLAFGILRWTGVKFENVNLQLSGKANSRVQKESSISLRDMFLFTFVSAIVVSIIRWIPLTYWYEIWFDRRQVWIFLALVCNHSACLIAVGLLSLWTCMSRRNIVIRWIPWLIALALFLILKLPFELILFVFGSFATLMIGLHAYRLRGWRFA